MNKIFVWILALLPWVSVAQGNIPQPVKFSFETMFPELAVQGVEADSLGHCTLWFKQGGKKYIVRYTNLGFWKYTGILIPTKEVPQALVVMMKERFPDRKVISVYKGETPFDKNIFMVDAGINRKLWCNSEGVIFEN